MGKWSNVGLPDEQEELSDWLKDVLEGMADRHGKTINELTDELPVLKEELKKIDEDRSKQTAKIEAVSRLILEALEYQNLDRITTGGKTYSPSDDVSISVKDKSLFEGWIRDTNRASLFEIPNSEIKRIVKDALDPEVAETLTPEERAKIPAGEPGSNQLPPGVDAYKRKALGIRKAKKR